MTIKKQVGDLWGIKDLGVLHKGPEIAISLIATLAPSHAVGHDDPVSLPDAYRLEKSALMLPEDSVEALSVFLAFYGLFPNVPDGTYDVNIAVGPVRSATQSFADWYSKRFDDDWDDAIYTKASAAPAPPPPPPPPPSQDVSFQSRDHTYA